MVQVVLVCVGRMWCVCVVGAAGVNASRTSMIPPPYPLGGGIGEGRGGGTDLRRLLSACCDRVNKKPLLSALKITISGKNVQTLKRGKKAWRGRGCRVGVGRCVAPWDFSRKRVNSGEVA